LRYSNNTIRIRILFLYSNIRIFDYSPSGDGVDASDLSIDNVC